MEWVHRGLTSTALAEIRGGLRGCEVAPTAFIPATIPHAHFLSPSLHSQSPTPRPPAVLSLTRSYRQMMSQFRQGHKQVRQDGEINRNWWGTGKLDRGDNLVKTMT